MQNEQHIIVTGAAGFIGSCMVECLNQLGYTNLVLVDDFSHNAKKVNWQNKRYSHIVERADLFSWLHQTGTNIGFVIHLGARTDTTEFDYTIHLRLNVEYSQNMWNFCTAKQVPLIYASSAATYGAGEFGYNDDHNIPYQLQPLNPYGISKNEFDKWAIQQTLMPPFWAGLKFFNVYGPNEYHKGRMASVIWHAFNQVKKDGFVKLFRSHRPDFNDGEQLRDFVYVKDVTSVIAWMMNEKAAGKQSEKLANGLYNLGTGKARSFYDLAANTFTAQGLNPDIRFIDMPQDIRDKYQYFTEANMQKLLDAGYDKPFYSLEAGIEDYVQQYLLPGRLL